jgi:phosphonate transport system substrate-binding protein
LPEYRFGVEPMRPTSRLWHRYAPLMSFVNSRTTDFTIHLESNLRFEDYLRRVQRSEFDFGIFEPHLVLEAEKLGYSIFARVGARDRIDGVVTTRRDSGIRSIRDLRGKSIGFGSPDSLASTMLVRLWLRRAGLRARDADLVFTTSQESALLEVHAGTVAAAAASRAGWEEFQQSNPEEAAELELKWRTDDLSGPAVMAHKRVPAARVRQVARALLDLSNDAAGRLVLKRVGYSEFRLAESGSYDDVWEFLNTYNRTFGRHGARP